MSLQLAGLASGFDWKSFVDRLISLERAPANTMQAEISRNNLRLTSLSGIETRLNDLRSATRALAADGLFDARAVRSSATGWTATATTAAPPGTYIVNVTQRATASTWVGATNIGAPLAPTNDVTGLTLANLGTALPPTAGEFTINGARISVALDDSLQDVFDRIASATGGAVTAAYDAATDRVTLSSSGDPIVLGSSTDTSNLLSALRLFNNGTSTVTSSASLGAVNPTATLNGSRLSTAITAVDETGAGSFTLNGVTIDYNVNTDSLNTVLARINASAAGVTATYDPVEDRVSLLNKTTGDLGIALSEPSGGLLSALGLTPAAGATLQRGQNATFTINGGPTLSSPNNTLDSSVHGIPGLTFTAPTSGGETTLTVEPDTGGMRSRIEAFITAFNSLQTYIESQTRVTSANGKVTTATLADNREVQAWGSQLRSAVFAAVPGLSETLNRLDHLGIDFNGSDSTLTIKNSAKLDAALRERPSEVAAIFRQSSTGLVDRLETLFNSQIGPFGGAGLLGNQRNSLTRANTSLTEQIAALDRRLEQRRAQLESGFIAMEKAQSLIQQMQTQLNNAFPTGGTNKR